MASPIKISFLLGRQFHRVTPTVTSHLRATSLLLQPLSSSYCPKCYKHKIHRPLKQKDEPVNELYENPELNVEPERKEYPEVWFHIKGYDFVPVEEYLSFLHRFLNSMDLSVEQVVIPPRCWDITTFKPNSELENNKYQLRKAHRILKIHGIPNTTLSLILDMVTRHLPAGVELSASEPDNELDQFRFIPDGDVKALQDAMYDLENPRLKKRK